MEYLPHFIVTLVVVAALIYRIWRHSQRVKPFWGGEFCTPRQLGNDVVPGCFVCGKRRGLYDNFAAFVKSKSIGERIVAMFTYGARLDYRDSEPNWIQVKIGSCEKHNENLKNLHRMVSRGRRVSRRMIARASK